MISKLFSEWFCLGVMGAAFYLGASVVFLPLWAFRDFIEDYREYCALVRDGDILPCGFLRWWMER